MQEPNHHVRRGEESSRRPKGRWDWNYCRVYCRPVLLDRHVDDARQSGQYLQITIPRFRPIVVAGPEFNRQVMVSDRDKFRWRGTTDPVIKLLRHGVLIEDDEEHDRLRACMEPALRRTPTNEHLPAMIHYTDQVLAAGRTAAKWTCWWRCARSRC